VTKDVKQQKRQKNRQKQPENALRQADNHDDEQDPESDEKNWLDLLRNAGSIELLPDPNFDPRIRTVQQVEQVSQCGKEVVEELP
jgi:hypothetical protein